MNEESLFAAAREIASCSDRQAYLAATCGSDTALRDRVEQLLIADARAQGILERGALTATFLASFQAEPLETEQLFADRFRLIEKIGEGGMGEVWVADQIEPVQRRVALKVIRDGLDSTILMGRFDQERQTLALLDHPNIARVIDAGTVCGRPFFVMDLIHGVSITRYCDEARLSPRQRLELFIPVCLAVQHAHQKGIIHRDLKPTNILVTEIDGKPVPKVIDFGIAKAIEQRPREHNVSTEVGTLVGTLEYMSPEQADLNDIDVDTRSDIYSLGVVLYELITGGVPFPHEQLRAVPFTEMLRIIKEVEPPKPSARLAESPAQPDVAAARRIEPQSLAVLVRGELDWVVMRCLEKDRDRRYETANGLAADLKRYLVDEPVLAGPPSARYRLRKFLRRNRGPVLAASLVLIALVGGMLGTTIGLVRADNARHAEAERAEGERLAKETAEKRLVQIEKGIVVLGSIFQNLDPRAEEKEGQPLRAILGERLDVAAAALDGEAIGDPLVAAKLQEQLGQTYSGLGIIAKAETLFTKSLATHRTLLGATHPLTLQSMHNLALAYVDAGKRVEAIALLEQVRDTREKELGAKDLLTLTTINDLAWANLLAGRKAGVIELLEKVRDIRTKSLGPDDPATLATLGNLAAAYLGDDRKTEAIELRKRLFDTYERKYGIGDRHVIDAMNNLAFAYQAVGKMDAAIELYEKARDGIVPILGPNHLRTLTALHNLAWMYRAKRRFPEAIALAEHVRTNRELQLGSYHPSTLIAMDNLAMAYRDSGDLARALPLFRQAAIGMERLKFDNGEAGRIVRNLCHCMERLKQFDEAEAWRRKWLAVARVKYGQGSTECTLELTGLGLNLIEQKKYREAEPVMRECFTSLQQTKPGDWETLKAQSILGATLRGQKRYEDAEPLLLQSYLAMKDRAPARNKGHLAFYTRQDVKSALQELVSLYEAWEKPDVAAKWRSEVDTQPMKK